jgi:hypothetical protein
VRKKGICRFYLWGVGRKPVHLLRPSVRLLLLQIELNFSALCFGLANQHPLIDGALPFFNCT